MPLRTKAPLSGLSILIVEDEFLIAIEAQHAAEAAGAARVELANSVSRARSLLAETPFHAVVLDLRLGEEDGGSLVSDLIGRALPFVIASGLIPDERGSAAERAVAASSSFIAKPYQAAELVAAIRIACARLRTD